MKLIDADKLYPDCLTKRGTLAISQSQIANAPTVDISKEVWSQSNALLEKRLTYLEKPQGEWIALKLPITEEEGDIKIICSNCKDEFIGQNDLKTWIKVYHFCPNCGADMRGEEK